MRPHPPSYLQMYSEEVKDFMVKVLEKSGLNPEGTFLPAAINPLLTSEPKNDMATALLEARMVMTGAVGELLEKSGEWGGWVGGVEW